MPGSLFKGYSRFHPLWPRFLVFGPNRSADFTDGLVLTARLHIEALKRFAIVANGTTAKSFHRYSLRRTPTPRFVKQTPEFFPGNPVLV